MRALVPTCARGLAASIVFATAALAQTPTAPTYANDIAPLIHRACANCHRPGQPAPFTLLTYDDVFKKRAQLVEVTQQRLMPPWPIAHGEFRGDRRLTTAEIELLQRWVDSGAPRGDAAHEPPPPTFASGWQLGEPDLVVRMPIALPVPASGPDLVRNFVIPIPVERLRYVDAVEIRPGNRAVHHAVLGVDGARTSRRLDEADPEPGFASMTLGGAVPPDGHFLGWTPGKSVQRAAAGTAWRLLPGCDFVLQLHVVPTGKAETVQAEIGLWFTDVATTTTFVGIAMFDDRIDIAPGERDHVQRDHLVLPVPVTLHALYPHAHRICRTMRATATPPNGAERVLFAIERWDFDWQDDYVCRQPIELPAGTRIAFEYHFDNSDSNPDNPNRPPQRVRFGQASADEMATLTLSVSLAPGQSRLPLDRGIVDRELEKVPEAWNVWLRKGRIERELGKHDSAAMAIARARELAPQQVDVWLEAALLAETRGRLDDATAEYRRVLERDAGNGLASLQLGSLIARRGEHAAALAHFERALAAMPNSPIAHNNVATANFALDRLDVAERHYRRALELEPDYFGPLLNLGRVLVRAGRGGEAKPLLQKALALRPGDAAATNELNRLPR